MTSPQSVVITSGARLHFGLLANGRSSGRQFGGVGLMLDRPGFTLRVAVAERDSIECPHAPPELAARIAALLEECRRNTGRPDMPPGLRVEVTGSIPAHQGLGSGTQLAMSIAQALASLADEAGIGALELARRAGRGARSALGAHGFVHGGFLVDGGKASPQELSPLVARVAMPMQWRFMLVRPANAEGLSGQAELSGFSMLQPMPLETTDRLCRIVLMELLPAVQESRFAEFASALDEFGRSVGDYFAPVQGGIFASAEMAELAQLLGEWGFRGAAQTSWGPTICVPFPDNATASLAARELRHHEKWTRCEIRIAAPLNTGAQIEIA